MKKEDYAKELRERSDSTKRADQKFYVNYSATALGLLMTLQSVSGGGKSVYGPTWLWITSLASFLLCLIISGPVTFYLDSRHFDEMAKEMLEDGALGDYSRTERILKIFDWIGRLLFLSGCAAAVSYFICQRIFSLRISSL